MHEKILDALHRGAHDEALALARTAIDADPGDGIAHRLMARALQMGGDHQGGLEAVDRAIALSPDDPGPYLLRASLLVGTGQAEPGRQALEKALELDPNQFGAYAMLGDLALGRGDLDEAERVVRVAGRIAPGHPVLQSIEAMVALGRGDKERALKLITGPLEQMPDNPQVLHAAGFIYQGNDHLAFAEQAFRRLRDQKPDHHALRRTLAELMYRQDRHAEALEEIEPLLEIPGLVSPESQRFAGELAMRVDDPQRALRWLRSALAAMPADRATLDLAMQAWGRLGDHEDARNALEALLSTSPEQEQLWRARFAVESDPELAGAVIERWMAAHPDSINAHEAQARLHMAAGDAAATEATLGRMLELAPDHMPTLGRLLELTAARDPAAAVELARARLEQDGETPERQRLLRGWLALANDTAGDFAEAARTWAALHAEAAGRLIPLPAPTAADAPRKAPGDAAGSGQPIAFLAGLPGSGIEYVARLLQDPVPAFRGDRIGQTPPQDPLQNINTIPGLAEGRTDPADVAAQWRAALPARGIAADGAIIDWLLWWDNALLDVIGPHLPQARVVLVLRDPRDMLLNWLAFGASVPLKLGEPQQAAQWLAGALEHVAVLQEQDLHPHALLRVDEVINDPQAMAKLVAEAVDAQLPERPPGLFQSRRFEAGHWREYADALQEPFATLTPVAVRLGYPEN